MRIKFQQKYATMFTYSPKSPYYTHILSLSQTHTANHAIVIGHPNLKVQSKPLSLKTECLCSIPKYAISFISFSICFAALIRCSILRQNHHHISLASCYFGKSESGLYLSSVQAWCCKSTHTLYTIQEPMLRADDTQSQVRFPRLLHQSQYTLVMVAFSLTIDHPQTKTGSNVIYLPLHYFTL